MRQRALSRSSDDLDSVVGHSRVWRIWQSKFLLHGRGLRWPSAPPLHCGLSERLEMVLSLCMGTWFYLSHPETRSLTETLPASQSLYQRNGPRGAESR
ncbi:hypothetical protein OH76DRAFT_657995 [Lentinus brumalis]|uniref:Uncharacterized protein n=1 Tax=Lentinus brumalis TaxID=2498619 RepID=A0A371D7I5_9APHY|nr:hypothetical protein OH76DRAFT_657995 [Polyporus brumalis]